MAIQKYIKYNFITRITNITSKFCQFLYRTFTHESPYVYFRYSSKHTHPGFWRFYNNPPVKWTTKKNAKLLHWISYPDFVDDRPFIIEPNDHILSAHGWKGNPTASSFYFDKLIIDSRELYEKKSCKAIILSSNKNIDIFKTYMPKKLWSKLVILPSDIGAISADFDLSIRKKSSHVKFLCMPSDYERKGIEIVLKAWIDIEKKHNSTLTIVCPNFPTGLKKSQFQSVKWIEEGPLSIKSKKELYSNHHVTLCPSFIDGGTDIIEALEFGMPCIVSEHHRTESFLLKGTGYIVSSPYQYYDVKHYGVTWKSIDEYLIIVKNAIAKGEFQHVEAEWKKYLLKYINDRSLSDVQGRNVCNVSASVLSNSRRNSMLRNLYKKILEKN